MVKVMSSTTFSPDMVLALGLLLALRVGALHIGVARERRVEVAAGLAVGAVGGVVPGIDEVLGLDVGAVLELVAGFSLTVKSLVVGGLDGLRDVVLRGGVLGVVRGPAWRSWRR